MNTKLEIQKVKAEIKKLKSCKQTPETRNKIEGLMYRLGELSI